MPPVTAESLLVEVRQRSLIPARVWSNISLRSSRGGTSAKNSVVAVFLFCIWTEAQRLISAIQ